MSDYPRGPQYLNILHIFFLLTNQGEVIGADNQTLRHL